MRFIVLLGILFLTPSQFITAQSLSVTSYGSSQEQARENALADLASRISVMVVAEQNLTESETEGDYSTSFSSNVLTRSELPILGADFTYQRKSGEIACTATISKERSARLYVEQIKQIKESFLQLLGDQSLEEMSLDRLFELRNLLEQLKKLELAGSYVQAQEPTKIPETITSVNEAVLNRAQSVSTWSDFSNIVVSRFKLTGRTVYVLPPVYEKNPEVTNFAKSVRDRLDGLFTTVSNQSDADIILRGSYRKVGRQLELTLRATNKEQLGVGSFTVKLNQEIFGDYSWEPETNSFDQLVEEGVAVSSELSVQLATNRGKTDLVFTEGETIDLLVKSNQSVYVYFVGYSRVNGEDFSYLLPIGYGDSKRDMILFINADDVNKWISLGEFEVAAPFGVERLQAFASSADLIDSLPEYYWNEDGYPVIGKDPNAALVQTRGLLRKKSEEAETAETMLYFTTMKR